MTNIAEQLVAPRASGRAARPLVVDLDGTVLRSDMFAESFFRLLAANPVAALKTALLLRHGRAGTKTALAAAVTFDYDRMPWNQEFLAYLRAERARGRRIYLASASAEKYVAEVAAYLGLFDGIFASTDTVNLKSAAKAEALVRTFGEGGFDYAGNESADFAVWSRAGGAVVVNATPKVQGEARRRWPDALEIGSAEVDIGVTLRAIRAHQWLKNLLLFVPAVAAHRFDVATIAAALLGFLSFSLCASSVYVLNDLIDLERDRMHPTKCRRPLASGKLPIMRALVMIPALLGSAIVIALILPPSFVGVLAGYYVLTLAYSLDLKRRMMLDVVALACLYGLRLVAGGVAAGVELSAWLAAFSLFLFFSLALVKRTTELVGRIARGSGEMAGRAYRTGDLAILEALGAASGFTSILVFALYISSPAVAALYGEPHRLWLICIVLIYWIGRIMILTHRGEMHDDPVVFAATDKASLACVALVLAIVAASL